MVRGHHERWDGAGYPRGLKGEEIPIGARIVSIADAVDSLASPRHHRAALPIEAAVHQVVSEAGGAFDPRLTALLAKRWSQWEKMVAEAPGNGLESIFEAQREAEVWRHLTARLSGSIELKAAYETVTQVLSRLLVFDALVVWLEQDGYLTAAYADGDCAAPLAVLRIRLGSGISGRVADTGQLILDGDASRENESQSLAPLVSPLSWALAAPLAAEKVRGTLTLYRSRSRKLPQKRTPGPGVGFSSDEARLISTVAPLLSAAISKALKYQDAKDRAGADALTGLPNAAALSVRLSALSGPCAVVLCDLDGFKQINDRFGHLTGNRLLEAVGQGFRRSCRSGDYVARMGGDEFVLLLDPPPTRGRPQEIEARLSQFRGMVRTIGLEITGHEMLDASFGVAFYPDDATSSDDLLKLADRHMYSCKEQHKSGVLALELELRTASD
jgi:diguanylate cyclase (GGDEF)-like protein